MSRLEISLFGKPTILVDNQLFDTDRRKAIALLAYLVVTGKPQPRQQLAALFWPDYDRDSAFAYLRRTLYELNKGLGSDWLLTDREYAGFNTSKDASVDTQVFASELAAARSAEDPLPHLEAAAAQYKGEFLAGFFLQDAEPFEDWLRLQQESYRREYELVLERLSAIYEQRGVWEPALKHALDWVALDDLNEAAHRAVMRILAGMGDRSRAIRQYETCLQRLKDELRVKPQPETTALYERIREGSFESARQVDLHSAETKNASELHLPTLTTPFIGRRLEVEQLKELILNPNNRLVTLLGPGGIGKTRLSIQAASEVSDRFPDGVWFVPLVPVQTPDGFIPALAKALNFSFYLEAETHHQQLLQYLQKKQLLIILDNLDHLISSEMTNLLIEVMGSAPQVKFLVSSRVRLNIQAEQVFPVPAMHVPTIAEAVDWQDLELQARHFGALQLFLDRARRVHPNFTLSHENIAAVVEICQMVSGMPLGLELAASWLELLSPEEIVAEIRLSLDFLETDQPDVPERQRSIRAVFDYSWKMLNENEREAFLFLSIFSGSFTRDAAQQVSGAPLRTLLSLVSKSWLQQVKGGRFQLHPLLQHYGLERLRENEQAWQDACERHALYYAGFMAKQALRMRGPAQLAAMEDVAEEFDTNIKIAWAWLVANERWLEIHEQMIIGLFHFGVFHSHYDELVKWFREVRLKPNIAQTAEARLTLAILGTIEVFFEEAYGIKEYQPADRLVRLWQLAENEDLAESMSFWYTLLGKIYVTRHQDLQAEMRIEAAIERIRKQGDPWLLGVTLLIQSYLWSQFPTGRLKAHLDTYLQEALSIFKELDTVYEQGEIYLIMAQNALAQKHPLEEILDLYQQAQQFYTKSNYLFGMAMIHIARGDLYMVRGRPEEAFESYHEMQRICDQIGNHGMLGAGLSWESLYATRYSTFEHALETRLRSIDHGQKYLDQTYHFWAVFELAETYRIFGHISKAQEVYEEARLNFERINHTLGLAYYQRAMGDIAMLEKRYADAEKYYLAYQSYAIQDNHMWSMAHALGKLGWVSAYQGDVVRSRSYTYRCLKSLQDADVADQELMILLIEARCLQEEGNFPTAVALAAYVTGHPIAWNETRGLAKALLADLAEKLDAKTFRSAYNRFQGHDLRELTSVWLADYVEKSA